MSYDISLQKIQNGDSGVCTPKEAEACINLLKTVHTDKPDEFNFVILEFEDGSSVEVSLWKDEKAIAGLTFFTRGISLCMAEFIYNMAVAGNFVILDTGGEDTPESPIAIMTSRSVLEDVGAEVFENPRLCKDIKELTEIWEISPDDIGRGGPLVIEVPNDDLPKPKPRLLFKRLFSKM